MANNRKVVFYDETKFSHSGDGDALINIEQTLNDDGIYFTPKEQEDHHIGHAGHIYTLGSKVIDKDDVLDKTVFISSDKPGIYMSGNEISVITDIKSNVFKKTLEVHHTKLDFGFLIQAINELYKNVNDQVSLVKFYAHIPGEESARLIDVVAVKNKTLFPSDLPGTGAVNIYLPSGSTKTFEGNWSTTDGGSQISITASGKGVDGTLKLYAIFVNANLGQHTITGFSAKSCTYGTESLLVNAGSCSTGTIKYTVTSSLTNAEVTGLKVNGSGVPYNKYADGSFLPAYDTNGNQIKYTVEAKVEETANYNARSMSDVVTISKASSKIECTTTNSSSTPIVLEIGGNATQVTLTLTNCTLGNITNIPTGVTATKGTSNTINISASQSASGYITVSGTASNNNYNNPTAIQIYIKAAKTDTSFTVSPSTVSIEPSKSATVSLSGINISTFNIATAPTASVATASISGKTLTITGKADGNTSVIISGTVSDSTKFNAPANKTVNITVSTAADRTVYSDSACTQPLFDASKVVTGKTSIAGEPWANYSKNNVVIIPEGITGLWMKQEFTVYCNDPLANDTCMLAFTASQKTSGNYKVAGVLSGAEYVILSK